MSHIRNSLSLLRHYGVKTAVKSELNALKYNRFTKRKKAAALIAASLNDNAELDRQRKVKFDNEITISILTPVYNTDEGMLKCLIDSVINQTYGKLELCFADGSDDSHTYVADIIKNYQEIDSRIRYMKLSENAGISENTNRCIIMATGDYFALLDHDDMLHPSALYKIAEAVNEQKADFIYTDEATFKGSIYKVLETNFKPDYAPDTLRGNNYICHLTAFSRKLYDKVGGFRKEYDGSQDHDMILRLTSVAEHIVHIPEILYFWRAHKGSVVEDVSAKEYAIDAGRRAVHDNLKSLGYNTKVTSTIVYPTIYKINYEIKNNPLVSIIIPNHNHIQELEECIESLINATYKNIEIIVIENNSTEHYTPVSDCISVYEYNIPFNYSKLNNYGVSKARGEYVLLLNNDTKAINSGFIEEMLMYASREDVGAVGAKLMYRNNTVQHCYVLTGMGEDRVAIHAHAGHPDRDYGYLGRVGFAQDVSAVTAACMMVKKALYEEVNGFDENLAVAYNDVDFCLKLRKTGKLIVYTPFATLYHFESATRGKDTDEEHRKRLTEEASYMKSKWGDYLYDPYYNPNFSLDTAYVMR